ncbi:MAG: acyl-CoA thioesterase [Thermodesulfobacteriota bacterium]|nr:acyl-CoA thioesterase [Thermodesulfobacteriota bacterium]
MQKKKVKDSKIIMAHQMLPQDANPLGNVHGGVIMRHIDTAGGVAAVRHVRGNAVTASIDRLDFLAPIYVGNLVHVRASVNMVGESSMEVGVRVEAENIFTGEVRHTTSAYLTYVALDESGRPTRAPGLIPETKAEKRRHKEALARRRTRKEERKRERSQ